MRSFDAIFDIAADRKGGTAILETLLERPKTPADIRQIPDDHWLAAMARGVFQAGFSWKVIDAKWPGFETAFQGFDPAPVAFYHDEDIDRLISDKGIVRHGPKIQSVIENARFVMDIANEHGSFGAFVAEWPDDDFVGLTSVLKKRGSRLGGNTGPYMLRSMGVDSFILSRDVVGRLVAEGVIDKTPTSQKALKATQAAFNTWRSQSGRSLTEISRVLAMSL
ncbi:DNA-3-methyladenine glycosylase I [Aestuariibius sp. HNIBRBA575]|uniref:DNA-3-methyladenine glycosylase I n=1 Tax=Aestuariibius sp. HNIBRBA575 TaxID=3233343 RepID=UPI0034A16E80